MGNWQFVARASLRSHADLLAQSETRWSIPLSSTPPNPSLVAALARSLLAGDADVDAITLRSAETLGKRWRWLRPLARRYLTKYAGQTRPRHRELVQFLIKDRGFRRAWAKYFDQLAVATRFHTPARMQPAAAAEGWSVPAIETKSGLADWLGVSVGELEWFADLNGLLRKEPCGSQLAHYNYRVITKHSGGVRVIESPKPRLKELQRQILTLILNQVPVHAAAHGFVRGRSIRTFVTPHVKQRVVLRMDLQNFFPAILAARVQTIFRMLGYPEPVADLLGSLCTNAAPGHVWGTAPRDLGTEAMRDLREIYGRPHLPQGAPTSPALANLCAYRVDCRLSGLALSAGAHYTRYADDLAFSGGEELLRGIERFQLHAAAVLLEEGFSANHRKTRVMKQGVRQQLAGLVVNQHPGIKRDEFDGLKAILTNCNRHGHESQNREHRRFFRAHLEGRVGFVESTRPEKGRRLRELFNKIDWTGMI